MNESGEDFMKNPLLAEKIKLPLKIVIEQKKMSAKEFSRVRKEKEYRIEKEICRLYAGAQFLGEGEISKKDGKVVFQIKTEKSAQGGKK